VENPAAARELEASWHAALERVCQLEQRVGRLDSDTRDIGLNRSRGSCLWHESRIYPLSVLGGGVLS
jgi:hypothetical protein